MGSHHLRRGGSNKCDVLNFNVVRKVQMLYRIVLRWIQLYPFSLPAVVQTRRNWNCNASHAHNERTTLGIYGQCLSVVEGSGLREGVLMPSRAM